MVRIASSKVCQQIDQTAQAEFDIPGLILMENAGIRAADTIIEHYQAFRNKRFLVVTGKGNNGGDGFVVARHLANRNLSVSIVSTVEINQLKGNAQINANIAARIGIPIAEITQFSHLDTLDDLISRVDCVIDAVFGIGLNQAIIGFLAEIIHRINSAPVDRVAIDIPSGLHADEIKLPTVCIKADLTVTFGCLKPSLILYPSAHCAGKVVTVDISLPTICLTSKTSLQTITPEHLEPILQPRSKDAHKGSFGHVLVIAGSIGKCGAGLLASYASLKAGAGLVTLATPSNCHSNLNSAFPEIMIEPVPSCDGNFFCRESLVVVRELLRTKTVIAIGPGIGTHDATRDFVLEIIRNVHPNQILILDADALNCLSQDLEPISNRAGTTIITPHPGEMARLISKSTSETIENQLSLIPSFSQQLNLTVVYKTARTLIAFPDGFSYINITGNPGMATAGSGDVLTGLIAGFSAQQFTLKTAVLSAVFLHGLAGDLAAIDIGESSLVASNILDYFHKSQIILKQSPGLFRGDSIPVEY